MRDVFMSEENTQQYTTNSSLSPSQSLSSNELSRKKKNYYLAATLDRANQKKPQLTSKVTAPRSPIVLSTPSQSQSQPEGRKMRTRNMKKNLIELALTPEDAETLLLYPWESDSQVCMQLYDMMLFCTSLSLWWKFTFVNRIVHKMNIISSIC